jgi:DoxX-like family
MKITTKQAHIIFRITTIALALFILPWLFFMNSDMAKEGMAHVGLTNAVWLQQLVGYGTPLAILLILIPGVWTRLKEWSYVGLGLIYIGAFWAHLQLGDAFSMVLMPMVMFAVLLVSYLMWHRMMIVKK